MGRDWADDVKSCEDPKGLYDLGLEMAELISVLEASIAARDRLSEYTCPYRPSWCPHYDICGSEHCRASELTRLDGEAWERASDLLGVKDGDEVDQV